MVRSLASETRSLQRTGVLDGASGRYFGPQGLRHRAPDTRDRLDQVRQGVPGRLLDKPIGVRQGGRDPPTGVGIGMADSLIAGIVVAHHGALLTRN